MDRPTQGPPTYRKSTRDLALGGLPSSKVHGLLPAKSGYILSLSLNATRNDIHTRRRAYIIMLGRIDGDWLGTCSKMRQA